MDGTAPNRPGPARRPGFIYDDLGDWARGMGVTAAAGVFLAFVNAFSFEGTTLAQRLVYWVPLMMAGGVMGTFVARVVFGAAWFAARPWLAAITVALLLTIPLTVLVWVATTALFGRPWEPRMMVYYIFPVAMVSLVMTGIGYISDRRPRETHAAPGAAAPPRFLDRMPLKLKGAELYAVEAEDHYLRIHTDRGSDLILMRLSDAVSELEGIEGAQTHRSWWVAKDAVTEVSRGDGRATFVLKNGARAPVSRTFARALRAEGWY